MQVEKQDKILVGQINGVYGVKGWVKVFSHTDPRENILSYSPWLVKVKGEWQSMKVLESKVMQGGKSLVASIEGIDDRDIARNYMGCDIAIDPEQLPQLDDEVYWRELIGSEVHNLDQVHLGEVTGLVETGAHDVLRVENKSNGTTYLIPFVFDNFIIEVDVANKQILVDWHPEDADETL